MNDPQQMEDTVPDLGSLSILHEEAELEPSQLKRSGSQRSNASGALRRSSQSSSSSPFGRKSRSQSNASDFNGGADAPPSAGGLFRRLSKKARSSIGNSLRPRLGSMSEGSGPQVFDITHPSLERFFWWLYSPAPEDVLENGEEAPKPPPNPDMTQEEKDRLPKYRLVQSEAQIGRLLERSEGFLSQSTWKGLKDVSVISFQAEGAPNEDRYSVNTFQWPISSPSSSRQIAHLLIVYDGHAGDLAVDHARANLPAFLESRITSASTSAFASPEAISELLRRSIEEFDEDFLARLTDRLPSWEEIEAMSDEEVKAMLMRDGGELNEWAGKVATGSCAVVGLIVGKDVWVAGLGDCEGVLAIKDSATSKWEPQTMAIIQNHTNPAEIERVKAAHPGEPAVFSNGRFCGLILCSRAFGDAWMKFPATFATRILTNTDPVGRSAQKIAAAAKQRFLTPPYISASADVKHHRIPEDLPGGHVALMLSSDGFRDMPFPRTEGVTLEAEWAAALGELIDVNDDEFGGNGLAAQLLRRSWLREDLHLASAMTTLPMKTMDDVTVMVAVL